MMEVTSRPEDDAEKDRRKFLAACAKFALTPPAITMLLSTSLNSSAIARSGGHRGSMRRSGGWGGRKSNGGQRGRRIWGGRKSGGWKGRKSSG